MIILLIGSLIVCLIFGGLSVYYTGVYFEQSIEEQLKKRDSKLNAQGIYLEYIPDSGFKFLRKEIIQLRMTQKYFELHDIPVEIGKPVTANLKQQCHIWPFYISCHNFLSLKKGHPFTFDPKVWNQFQYQWKWQFTALTQRITSQIQIEPIALDSYHNLKISPIQIRYESDVHMDYNTTHIKIDHMLIETNTGLDLEVDHMYLNLFFDYNQNKNWSLQNSLKIDNIHLHEIDNTLVNIDHFLFKYKVNKPEDEHININSQLSMDKINHINLNQNSINNVKLDIDILNINPEVGDIYADLENYTDEIDDNESEALLEALSQSPVILDIHTLEANYKEVNLQLKGKVELPVYFSKNQSPEAQYLNKIKGDLEFRFSPNIDTIYPVMKNLIPIYTQEGILEKDMEQKYLIKLELKDGLIFSNNKKIGKL